MQKPGFRSLVGLVTAVAVAASAADGTTAETAGTEAAGAPSRPTAADPLDSPRWEDMHREVLGAAPVRFDSRITVTAPVNAEDPLNVPISVDASAVPDIREVVVFADFNPIVKVLGFEPASAAPRLGFRVKLQQSSPVRAAARTADGVWHVGGSWVRTSGGGCTLPSVGSASPLWQQHLNEVSARLWPGVGHGDRLRLRIVHPMDTGLAAGIPAFHIEELAVSDRSGALLMRIQTYEPVAENPVFTIDLNKGAAGAGPLHVTGRDNNGNRIDARVKP